MGSSVSDLAPVLDVALQSWQRLDGGTFVASSADPEQKVFYALLAEMSAARDWLSLPVLWQNDHPLAFQYNLHYQGVTYHLKAGFDGDYGKLAPGALLNITVLQKAIEDGDREYDFAGNAGKHKLQWSKTVREHSSFDVYNRNLKLTMQYRWKYQVRPYLKSKAPLVKKFEERIRRRLGL